MKAQLNLTHEQRTMLITLSGKAMDYRSKHSILNDQKANEIIESIGIDITYGTDSKNRIIAVRARQFDEWVTNFIRQNAGANVINLGCGLDTRISRIHPPSPIHWYDVDFPEVIDLRKRFYSDDKHYQMIATSVTDEEWVKSIANDKPTLIVAEGLLSYLSEQEVKDLLHRLTNYFQKGEIVFNVISNMAREKGIKTTGAIQKWTVENIEEVDRLNAKMKRIEILSLFESEFIKGLPFLYRTMLGLAAGSKKYKNMIQLLRYKF